MAWDMKDYARCGSRRYQLAEVKSVGIWEQLRDTGQHV